MLETGIITLMTLEKNVDNFINVIKGKGQNPCGLRNLTGGEGGKQAIRTGFQWAQMLDFRHRFQILMY